MGSPPTLDPTWTRLPDLDRPHQDRQLQERYGELLEHLQTRPPSAAMSSRSGRPARSPTASAATWTPATATTTPASPTSSPHTHPELARDRSARASGPSTGSTPSLGCRPTSAAATATRRSGSGRPPWPWGVGVAVHDSRQNDPNPVIWQAGQDYRMADAIQAARREPTRARWGPERTGPER